MRRILWFRRDLRADDNRLLAQGGDVLPIFIFDRHILDVLPTDDRRVAFVFDAVMKLKEALRRRGLDLALFYGAPEAVFGHLSDIGAEEVCASGDYDRYARERDRAIAAQLPLRFLDDTYMFGAEELLKRDGTPYLVFTPFYKRAKAVFGQHHLDEAPWAGAKLIAYDYRGIVDVKTGQTLPMTPASIGCEGQMPQVEPPKKLLARFGSVLASYASDRDRIDKAATSDLGIHLRFGTLGIRQLLRWLVAQKRCGVDTEPFFRQLVFRDFYTMLLYHFPHLHDTNFRYAFQGIENETYFRAFCTAGTGVPIVDAGVRQLIQTGRMHNRVRMICASFFTKDLLLPWPWGEAFFARHLLDYDAASNILSWQWSAGTGVDPQPYFRVFNPYTQSKKFDPQAQYIKMWMPEYDDVEASRLHDETWLSENGDAFHGTPIVDHKIAAKRAIEVFKKRLDGS